MIRYIEFWFAKDIAAVLWFVAMVSAIFTVGLAIWLLMKFYEWILKR